MVRASERIEGASRRMDAASQRVDLFFAWAGSGQPLEQQATHGGEHKISGKFVLNSNPLTVNHNPLHPVQRQQEMITDHWQSGE